MNRTSNLLILLSLISLASCSMLDRRDHMAMMDDRLGGEMFRPYDDFEVVPGDEGRFTESEGFVGRVPATAEQRGDRTFNRSIFNELQSLENRLGDQEYEEYMQVKGALNSDHERIYYLRLLPQEKQQYLQARNIRIQKKYVSVREFHQSRASNIVLGMGKNEVLGTMGQPDRRDFAGSPMEGNERWAYHSGGRVRYIFFESGQVDGWTEQ